MKSSLVVPFAALALVVPVAGCGSAASGGSADADPAAVVPASAPIYLEAVVRPDGKLRADTEAVARKVLRTDDPGKRLIAMLDKSLKKDGSSYAKDIEPWLGKRIGVAVMGLGARGQAGARTKPDFAVIAATTDTEKAAAVLTKGKGKVVDRSYRDTDYKVDAGDKTAGGVIGDTLVVAGTERTFRQIVDANEDGRTLAKSADLASARKGVSAKGLAFAYVDPSAAVDALASDPMISAFVGPIKQSLTQAGVKAVGAGLGVGQDLISIEAATIASRKATSQAAGQQGAAARTLGDLPAGSVVAAGLGDLGTSLDKALQGLSSGPGAAVLGQLNQAAGLDIKRDLLAWMGDAGIFVRGGSLSDIGGALVVKSKDPAASGRAVGSIARLIKQFAGTSARVTTSVPRGFDEGFRLDAEGLPIPVFVGTAGDRFVVAVGKSALAEALSPSRRLADDTAFKTAAGKLGAGVKPSVFVDLQSAFSYLGLAAGSNPDFQRAKPYLDAYQAIVAGGATAGSTSRTRMVIALR